MADGQDFAEAERRIAEAREAGATHVDLSRLSLDRLPDTLGELITLTSLDLGTCEQLTDLSPRSPS